MGVFGMVVLIVAFGTIGKIVTAWIHRTGHELPAATEARIRALEEEARARETRLSLAEERVEDLTEKLSFVERLLAEPRPPSQLPPA